MGNLCFAPVHGNTKTGEVTLTYSYYYIGHFSKFIRPGAKRVSSVSSANSLMSTAFLNLDGSLVIVAMNQSDAPLQYGITMDSKTAKLEIPSHGIQTIVMSE